MPHHRHLEERFDISLSNLFHAHLPEHPPVVGRQTNLPDHAGEDAQAASQVLRCELSQRLRRAEAMRIGVSGVVVVPLVKGFRPVNFLNDIQPAPHDFLVWPKKPDV
jgi:hypothetical protein